MANLLNWSGGLSIRKKEDENTQAPLINSLRTLNPTPVKTSSINGVDVASLRNNVNSNSSGVTNAFARAQQVNDQIRQQAEQRRQEEERQRQEQEQRRQQEEARRAQEQQAQQQKQQNLLKSSLQGGSLLNNLSNNGPTGEKMANQINKSLALSDTIAKGQANMNTRLASEQRAEAEKQRQLNEAETNRLTKAYTNQINQNADLLNKVRSGEEKLGNNAYNKLSQDAFKGNFNQPEPALRLSNNLSERSLENQVKGDEDILERIKNGSRPITLGQGLKMVAEDKLEQGLGNAILGEQTEDEDFGKQLLRSLINLPGSMVGEPLRLPGLLQDASNPNGTKNVIEKNSDGTASINAKENGALNRLGSAAEAAIIPLSMFAGGATANVAKTIGKGLAKTSLKDAGKQIAKTGLEEAAQEAGQNLAQELSEEGKWDEGTLGRTAQAAAMGGIAGGLVSGITSGAGAINDRLRSRQTDNATNVTQNTEVNATNVANNGIDVSQIRKTNDGQLVKQDANGTTTRLSDAELANAIDQNNNTQQNTTNSLNSSQNNALNLRSSTDDVNTMSRRASQGDTYAQQRLAELTKQNQEENADWRGKNVDEVINPERNATNVAQNEIIPNGTIQNERQLTAQEEGQNTLQNASNDFGGRTFDELTPVEQEEWLANNSNQVPSETQLAQALRQMGIDPTGMSQLDMLREYSRAVNNTAPEVRTANEIENNPEVLPSERNVAERTAPAPVAISPENLAQEPTVPTRTDTVGTGEGTIEASTRIPTEEELSVRTPEQQANDAQMPRGEVDSVAELMNTPSGKSSFVTVLKGVSNKVRDVVKNAIGIDVSGYNHTMDSSSVRHALNKHSNDAIPLEVKDLDLVPDIIKNADTVEYSRKNGRNLDTIVYTKQYGNKVAYVEEIRNGRHQLAMNTMYWVGKGQQKSTPTGEFSDNSTNSGRALPRPAGSAYDGIVAQNGENVNANSSFAVNTSANNNFSEETRRALKNDPISYTPTTNEERLARANEILSTKTPDEVDTYLRDNFFNVKAKNASSEDMVLAGEFAKMLDARGQYDRSTEIINKMSEIGTKQGQNIQAMSLMMNRSPEGIANMAQNAIKKGGGEMNGEVRRQIVEKTQEIGRTRGKRAQLAERNDTISQQIMNGEGDLKALRKEQMQIAQAYRQNLDQEGRQFAQLTDVVNKNSPDNRSIFGSVWRAGLLSGPRTHTGNALSNIFQNVLNAGSDRIASGLDWARAKVTGTEREVVGSDRGLRARGKGLKRGLSAAKEVLKTGDNLWEGTDIVTGKTTAWGQGGELEFKNKVANNMVAKPTNYVFRAMSAGDLPFRYAAFENAIRTEAKRQGINQGYKGQALQDYINSRVATPDPELQAYGIRKGNESVYDIDTKLSDVMNRVDKFIDGQENKLVKNGLKGVKTLVAPFVKVPSKVLSTAIDYSPLGSVKAIVNKVGSKGYTTAQFETDLAKSGLGTAGFVGLGYALSAAGLLTGGYPDSADERNRWKAEGIEPNSIKIGDTYLSLNYLGPASMLMAMGSGVQQRQANGEDALSIAQGTVMDTLNTFLDQSYVQGLSNALNAITDSNRYGESYVNSFARGLVPNLLRQTATATDPMQRQVNNAGEAVVSGIPGASQNLDAKVDTYGREIGNKQTLPLGQMWDALKLSNSREMNDVITEVNRLHNVDPSNKDLQVTPPKEDNTLSIDGENIKITDAQKTQLQKDTGNAAITAMRQVMQSDEYAGLSDQEKAKALDKARSDAQTEARKKFIEANNITSSNNPETRNSGGSTTGDYASKAISKATSNTEGKSGITVNDDLDKNYRDILNKYNSMSSDEWDEYIYGETAEAAAAEYLLAKAKFENDLANGDMSDVQKIRRQKELDKLEVSQEWTKDYRDAYSLAGTKADMQEFLDAMDDETRAKTVAVLNGLNNAMLEAGVIKESTYKTRYNAINNTSSSKSSGGRKKGSGRKSGSGSDGISSAEASAMSSLAKTMVKNTNKGTTKTAKAPETKRKMARTKSSGNKTSLATYTPSNKKVTVSKGAKQSIA